MSAKKGFSPSLIPTSFSPSLGAPSKILSATHNFLYVEEVALYTVDFLPRFSYSKPGKVLPFHFPERGLNKTELTKFLGRDRNILISTNYAYTGTFTEFVQ